MLAISSCFSSTTNSLFGPAKVAMRPSLQKLTSSIGTSFAYIKSLYTSNSPRTSYWANFAFVITAPLRPTKISFLFDFLGLIRFLTLFAMAVQRYTIYKADSLIELEEPVNSPFTRPPEQRWLLQNLAHFARLPYPRSTPQNSDFLAPMVLKSTARHLAKCSSYCKPDHQSLPRLLGNRGS